ncbi:MAG: hypothetical protein LBG45_06485 [Dysgonamonadaceae bacterium]|jgi:hypothetical protein|nr:hypothetical protein [Dysgonamonadaceae bacterium]
MKIRALEKTEIKILARLLYEAIARRAYSNKRRATPYENGNSTNRSPQRVGCSKSSFHFPKNN